MDNKNNKEEKEARGLVRKWIDNYLDKRGVEPVSKEDLNWFKGFVEKNQHRKYTLAQGSDFWGFSKASRATHEDKDIYEALPTLRKESRQLYQNNSIQKKYIEICETNIVGASGFNVQVTATFPDGKLDLNGNKSVEQSWEEWCTSNWCDITGKLTFKDAQRVIGRTIPKDGEILIRKIRQKATRDNPWGFSIQLIDAERLDIRMNEKTTNGNIVKMGVEMNQYGRPEAYHLRLPSSDTDGVLTSTYDASARERVPASDILHSFRMTNPEQTRGMPWAHSVMTLMSDLEDFLRACLIASKVGASTAIYLEQDTVNSSLTAADIADRQDEYGQFEMEISPGDMKILPAGLKMQTFKAEYPSQNFEPYVTVMLKLIASGLNINYYTLANSLDQINLSSGRIGQLDERDHWMNLQDMVINQVIKPIYEDWLNTSLLNGAIKFADGTPISATKYSKFKKINVLGRRWPWTDILKEGQANILAMKNGLTSKTAILAALGVDYERVLQDRKAEMELEKIYGISFDITDTKGSTDSPQPTQEEGKEE